MAKPPLKLQHYVAKMPRSIHAFFAIVDGYVDNPEFVADYLEGDNEYCWSRNMQKWKREVLPTLKRSKVTYWELHKGVLSEWKQ